MFKMQIVVFSTTFFCVNNLYLPQENLNPGTEKAEEIQNAICSITTKELEATANATITRQLKGVCTSSEMNSKIDQLQTKILQEIDGIRYILELSGFKVPDLPSGGHNPASDFSAVNSSVYGTMSTVPLPVPKSFSKKSPRGNEILIHNDTVLDSTDGNKYFYYWKVDDVHELLSKSDMYVSSPDFIVLGHTLHLQLYPSYLDRKHFAVLLKPDSPGFIKKHKLAILNRLDPGLDLTSGVLYGLQNKERMLRVSHSNLRVEGFVVQDSIIVKVISNLDTKLLGCRLAFDYNKTTKIF